MSKTHVICSALTSIRIGMDGLLAGFLQEMAAAIAIEQLTLRSLAGQAEQLCGDMDFTDKAIIQNKVDNLTKDLVELQSRLENKQKDLESR